MRRRARAAAAAACPAPPRPPAPAGGRPSSLEPPEHERRVLPAEPERVRHGDADVAARRRVGGNVEARGLLVRLIVGGTQPVRIAWITAIAPSAPAAPSVCPIIDLLAVIETSFAWSPKIDLIALSSARSPSAVDVAWALT